MMSGIRLLKCSAALAGGLLCVAAGSPPASNENPATGPLPTQSSPPANQLTVDQLIDALGSPDYDERQQATDILKGQKTSFAAELARICRTVQDLEIRLRLVEVAEFLFYKEALKDMGGFLGIQMDATPPRNQRPDLDQVHGVRVLRAITGSAADKGDIRTGDVLVAIDGKPLSGDEDRTLDEAPTVRQLTEALIHAISSVQPGADITLTILRDGNEFVTKVTLGPKPLSLVRQNLATGRLGSDHRAALEAARQEFARWLTELEGLP